MHAAFYGYFVFTCIPSELFHCCASMLKRRVTGRFGPIPVRTPGRFGPIPFRSGRFGPGRFGPI